MQPSVVDAAPSLIAQPLQVRVIGPDASALTPAELRRLFRGRRLTPARRQRLAASGRVLAHCDKRVVGVAAFDPLGLEVRVHEFGVDSETRCPPERIASVLLEALEVACLACGARRLVLLPRAALTPGLLRSRGFVTIAEECAGSWFEKSFPS